MLRRYAILMSCRCDAMTLCLCSAAIAQLCLAGCLGSRQAAVEGQGHFHQRQNAPMLAIEIDSHCNTHNAGRITGSAMAHRFVVSAVNLTSTPPPDWP